MHRMEVQVLMEKDPAQHDRWDIPSVQRMRIKTRKPSKRILSAHGAVHDLVHNRYGISILDLELLKKIVQGRVQDLVAAASGAPGTLGELGWRARMDIHVARR